MINALEHAFLWVLQKSLPVAVVVLCTLFLRMLIGKYPKKYAYALWAPLAVRLLWIWPVTNHLSIFHLGIFQNVMWKKAQAIPRLAMTYGQISGAGTQDLPLEQAVEAPVKTTAASMSAGQQLLLAATVIWALGVAVFAVYFVVSCYRVRQRVRTAVRLRGNIYECEEITSPFVMGIVRPRIYLPFGVGKEHQDYVLCHEQYHIRRKDYLVKPLAFFLLAAYWFHPLVWLSYFLMCQDMEMSCDEAVLEQMGMGEKQGYSKALLAFAAGKRLPGNLLGFGEHHAKNRILHVLQFHQPGKVMISLLGILCVLSVMFFGCEASEGGTTNMPSGEVSEKVQEIYGDRLSYLGDASGVSRLLRDLEGEYLPEEDRALELDSSEHPYVLRLVYPKLPMEEEKMNAQMIRGGTLLLALIENLDEFQWVYPKEEGGQDVTVTGYWDKTAVAAMLPDVTDVKECGKSPEALSGLMELLDAQEQSVLEQTFEDVSHRTNGGVEGPADVVVSETKKEMPFFH
ncbi:MAG: M56 family metallopeptidase [Blautia sp.]|jgi:beta-lactamase regulating signal transducer with metallopeptidase domain